MLPSVVLQLYDLAMSMDSRREIEKRLGRKLAPWEWSGLEAHGYVEDLDLGVESLSDVVQMIRSSGRPVSSRFHSERSPKGGNGNGW